MTNFDASFDSLLAQSAAGAPASAPSSARSSPPSSEQSSPFDQLIDRRASSSKKWDKYQGTDILPFWIADMDFAAPDFIQEAMRNRLEHGIHGYTHAPAGLSEAVVNWSSDYCQYTPPVESLVWLPGVVAGLNVSARALAQPGGAIAMHTPIYYPFLDVPANADQQAIHFPLVREQKLGTQLGTQNAPTTQHWVMDFDAMAHQLDRAGAPTVTALLFCNPHNPTGRVYSVEEVTELAEFCLRRNIVVVSDEIHCPLVLDASCTHIGIAGLAPEVARNTITLQAPTKAWNLAGASSSVAIIEDPELRERFCAARAGMISNITPFAYAAAEAAYADQSSYLADLSAYLERNHQRLQNALRAIAPNLATPVEATYLAWLDVRGFPSLNTDPEGGSCGQWFEARGLGLSDGAAFKGPGFVRFNFAAPRQLVDEGIRRLLRALQEA